MKMPRTFQNIRWRAAQGVTFDYILSLGSQFTYIEIAVLIIKVAFED